MKLIEKYYVCAIVARRAGTTAAVNNMLRMLQLLMRIAGEKGWRKDDLAIGVKKIKARSGHFRTCPEEMSRSVR